MRPSGRAADALRDVSHATGFAHHAEGSRLIRMGRTEVPSAASVETSCAAPDRAGSPPSVARCRAPTTQEATVRPPAASNPAALRKSSA
jgi:ribonuclease PH